MSVRRSFSGHYNKTIERLTVSYRATYGDGMCVEVACRDGWNDSCPILTHRMSLEEVHDLRYLLDRMLVEAQGAK